MFSFRSDFQCVILIKAKGHLMLFHGCLNQLKQPLFLQRRSQKLQNTQNREVLSPNSKMSQKVSLKTLKSIKSQKSLKTISTNEDIMVSQGISLKQINEWQGNNTCLASQGQDFKFFPNPFPETERRLAQNTIAVRTQRKTSDISNVKLPKICITYQKTNKIRNFVSPDPRIANNQIKKKEQAVSLLKIPQLNLDRSEEKRIEEATQQKGNYSIAVISCKDVSLQNSCIVEKEEDMKSTHFGGQKLQLPFHFPSRPKSTVSMLSERSSCDSVIMDREFFKNSVRITKLI